MKGLPWFPLYTGDWLGSQKIAMMTNEEEGAYIRLLCCCWDDPDCGIPDDDDKLAKLSRLGEGWFKGGSTTLRDCFIPHPGIPGKLTNQRLLDLRLTRLNWQEKSRLGGIKSGEARRIKAKTKGGSTNDPTKREPNANESESESESESEEEKEKKAAPSPSKRFEPPTLEEVAEFGNAYAADKGMGSFDAEAFMFHYQSNDWKVGPNKMKDWQAAAMGWIRRDFKDRKDGEGRNASDDFINRAYRQSLEMDVATGRITQQEMEAQLAK